MTFAHYEEIWAECFEHGLGQPIPQRLAAVLEERRSESEVVFGVLAPVVEACERLFVGKTPSFPAAPQASVMYFLPRILKIQTLDDLSPKDGELIQGLLRDNFLIGLAGHLILWSSDNRSKVQEVAHGRLFRLWTEQAGMADTELREYNRHQEGLPGTVSDAHFRRNVQPVLKRSFSVGAWKMGKAQNRFRNLYYSGILLGMVTDLATDRV